MLRTGLFGGTFAPPHLGHLHAANAFLHEIDLDELIIMPAFIPPHKQKVPGDLPEIRYKMCQALFGSLPRTEISDYEIKKEGISYTVDTLEYLRHQVAERKIYLLCGADMFLTLDSWKNAERIFSLAEIVCMPRYDDSYEKILEKKIFFENRFSKKIRLLSEPPFVLSSTEIREKIRRKSNLTEYLTPDVIKIIESEGLYL